MRNTLEHPVDAEEAAATMLTMIMDMNADLIGDMRPYILTTAAAFILSKKDEFDEYVRVREAAPKP